MPAASTFQPDAIHHGVIQLSRNRTTQHCNPPSRGAPSKEARSPRTSRHLCSRSRKEEACRTSSATPWRRQQLSCPLTPRGSLTNRAAATPCKSVSQPTTPRARHKERERHPRKESEKDAGVRVLLSGDSKNEELPPSTAPDRPSCEESTSLCASRCGMSCRLRLDMESEGHVALHSHCFERRNSSIEDMPFKSEGIQTRGQPPSGSEQSLSLESATSCSAMSDGEEPPSPREEHPSPPTHARCASWSPLIKGSASPRGFSFPDPRESLVNHSSEPSEAAAPGGGSWLDITPRAHLNKALRWSTTGELLAQKAKLQNELMDVRRYYVREVGRLECESSAIYELMRCEVVAGETAVLEMRDELERMEHEVCGGRGPRTWSSHFSLIPHSHRNPHPNPNPNPCS